MEQLSPFTRKVVAVGLLCTLLVSIINLGILPLIMALGDRLDRLQAARLRLARLERLEAAPALPFIASPRASLVFNAETSAQALDMVRGLVRDLASRTGATVEMRTPAGSVRGLSASIIVTGSELAVIDFINQLERNEPVVRFSTWKLSSQSATDGQVHMEGQILAAWTKWK